MHDNYTSIFSTLSIRASLMKKIVKVTATVHGTRTMNIYLLFTGAKFSDFHVSSALN